MKKIKVFIHYLGGQYNQASGDANALEITKKIAEWQNASKVAIHKITTKQLKGYSQVIFTITYSELEQ